jgi:hypothetical protein
MDNMFCTEQEVIDLVLASAATVDVIPDIFVAKRETSKDNSLVYTCTIAVQTAAGNEALIVALMKMTLEHKGIKFNGSDVDVQGGNLLVDFLWVEATIRQILS